MWAIFNSMGERISDYFEWQDDAYEELYLYGTGTDYVEEVF